MTVNDILEYVMNTPHNTNRTILKGMLDSLVADTTTAADADDPVVEEVSINENGVTNAPEGKVYNKVTVAVPVPTLTELNVTEAGTYTAPEGTAYNSVVVTIAQSGEENVEQPAG